MDLDVVDLSVARGGVPLLAELSFRLPPGRALILRGPNGCGKTTLLRCLVGLQPPLQGHIHGAEDRLAYAGHADGLKAMLTVRENLDVWSAIFGRPERVDMALEAFALGELHSRPAGQLSAGQKRRLGLARLLVTGRPVWVLDEPTVSLDAASVTLFASVVQAHLAGGGSAMIATHIDLGLQAETLDLTHWAVRDQAVLGASDEAFL